MKFSIILKELRTQQNLTQQELADKLGLSRSIIGFWECGKKEPTAKSLILLAKFFEVSADYLLGIEDEFKY